MEATKEEAWLRVLLAGDGRPPPPPPPPLEAPPPLGWGCEQGSPLPPPPLGKGGAARELKEPSFFKDRWYVGNRLFCSVQKKYPLLRLR